eukprot:1104864-Rhodomonas_salina.1
MPVQVVYCPRRRLRNAFKSLNLKAGQQRYQLSIKPWSSEEQEFNVHWVHLQTRTDVLCIC